MTVVDVQDMSIKISPWYYGIFLSKNGVSAKPMRLSLFDRFYLNLSRLLMSF